VDRIAAGRKSGFLANIQQRVADYIGMTQKKVVRLYEIEKAGGFGHASDGDRGLESAIVIFAIVSGNRYDPLEVVQFGTHQTDEVCKIAQRPAMAPFRYRESCPSPMPPSVISEP
jgi:hypothetical protein